jgi:hypothetical protein
MVASLAITLLRKPKKAAPSDDYLDSIATRGAYVPLGIGRFMVGPVFAWGEMNDNNFSLSGDGSGSSPGYGKGNRGGSSNHYEKALHLLCVGPGEALYRITQNGKLIWEGPVTPASHPSGSELSCQNGEGSFRIYWGYVDDPTLPYLPSSPTHGLTVKYAYVMKVLWVNKNLGNSRVWPRLQYEVSCPCYSQLAETASQMPLEPDDAVPVFTESSLENIGYMPSHIMPPLTVSDKAQFQVFRVCQLSTGEPAVLVANFRRYSVFDWGDSDEVALNRFAERLAGMICKVYFPSDITGVAVIDPLQTSPPPQAGAFVLPSTVGLQIGSWDYRWVKRAYVNRRMSVFTPVSPQFRLEEELVVVLGPSVSAETILHPRTAPPTLPYVSGICIGGFEPVSVLGADGINPIHIVDQLLFAKKPWGAGRDRSKFDTRSIEQAAVDLEKENIRGYCVVKDGDGAYATLGSIMQDLGLMISWDPQTGKNVFRVIRYQDPDTVVDVPEDMVITPAEVVSPRGRAVIDTPAFTFKNRDRRYREDPLVLMDDGQITYFESERSKKFPIVVTADPESAVRMVPRRQQEVLADTSSYKFEFNHGMRRCLPGSRFKVPSFEGAEIVFLATEVQRYTDSGKIGVSAIVDSYSLRPSTEEEQQFVDSPPPGSPTPPPPDADPVGFLDAVEVPRPFAAGSLKVLFPAYRKSASTTGAYVWASIDGGGYSVLDEVPLVVAGTLASVMPSAPEMDPDTYYDIEEGLLDTESIEDLSYSPASWKAGRQVLLIEDEVIFLLRQDGDRLQGLIRGRMGTKAVEHAEGTPFVVFLSHRLPALESLLFLPGRTIDFKVQGQTRDRLSDISLVSSKSIELQGLAYTPLPPCGLRQPSLRRDYDSGASLELVWGWHSSQFPRTGLGQQGFGQVTSSSAPLGHFLLTFKDDSGTKVADMVSPEPALTLSPGDRSTIGLDALPFWTVEVQHVEGSYRSAPSSLTLFPA